MVLTSDTAIQNAILALLKAPSAWDDTSTADVVYLKHTDRVVKINKADKTILTCLGGDWGDRTSLTYVEV